MRAGDGAEGGVVEEAGVEAAVPAVQVPACEGGEKGV